VTVVLYALAAEALEKQTRLPSPGRAHVGSSFVVTQLPSGLASEQQEAIAGEMLRADYGERARLVMVLPDLTTRVLSQGFYSACDPDISFDASHIPFAGKKSAADNWNIFEMTVDGSDVRQITKGMGIVEVQATRQRSIPLSRRSPGTN
jgi:hypothetical protein